MSKRNTAERQFNTVFRMSTVLHPNFDSKLQATAHSYTEIRTISTRGSWPVAHIISEASLIRLAVASGQLPADALKLIT